VPVLVLVPVLMLMVVVEIHESLGEKNLGFHPVLMLHLLNDCVLIEGQELMSHCVPNHNCLAMMFQLLGQMVLLASSQMIELPFQLLYLFQFENVGVRRFRFVYYLMIC
jgi:hypothetical protein